MHASNGNRLQQTAEATILRATYKGARRITPLTLHLDRTSGRARHRPTNPAERAEQDGPPVLHCTYYTVD